MTYTLITGASSGIGFELAHVFARHNHNLILVARSTQKLLDLQKEIESKYKVVAHVFAIDLSKPRSAAELYEKIKSENKAVDILVNNAGIGEHGLFENSSLDRVTEMINLNVTTLAELTHLFLKDMLKQKSGRILNVASTAAFQAGPLMTVYYATKAFVLSFSEGLAEELSGKGVSVTALCPGPTASGFQAAANMSDIYILENKKLPTSQEVADYGYKALMNGKVIAVHGLMNSLMAAGSQLLPRSLSRKVVMKLQQKRLPE